MAQLRESILKVVAYFDLFNYPVTLEEIRHFLDQPVHGDDLPAALESLLDKQLLWQHSHYYSCKNDPQLVERRKRGNQMAVKQLKKAMQVARVLSWFPYVRGVGISGSLSKNIAYKGSDLDFFIITAANRLWIAKILLQLLVRMVILVGQKRLCCLNYYIDEQALEIGETNIFIAIEVNTLLPARGKQIFQRFFAANQWISEYLPNSATKQLPADELQNGVIKRLFEYLLDNSVGEKIDNWLLQLHSRRWKRQLTYNKLDPNGFPIGGISCDKHYCKPLPQNFQNKVLSRYQENVNTIRAKYTLVMD